MAKTKLINKKESIQFNLPNGTKSPVFKNGDEAAEWYVQNFPRTGYHITTQQPLSQQPNNPTVTLPEITVYPNVAAKKQAEEDQNNKEQIINGNYFGHKFTPTDQNINYYLNLYDKDKQVHNATDSKEWAKFALANVVTGAGLYGIGSAVLASPTLTTVGKIGADIGLGYVGGKGVDQTSKAITGKTFGQNLGDAVTNNTSLALTPELADMLNPGYLLAFNNVYGLRNKALSYFKSKSPELKAIGKTMEFKTENTVGSEMFESPNIWNISEKHQRAYPVEVNKALPIYLQKPALDAMRKKYILFMKVPIRSKIPEVDDLAKALTQVRGRAKSYYQSRKYRKKFRQFLEDNALNKDLEGTYIHSIEDRLDTNPTMLGMSSNILTQGAQMYHGAMISPYRFHNNFVTPFHEYAHAANQFGTYNPTTKQIEIIDPTRDLIQDYNKKMIQSLPINPEFDTTSKYWKYVINEKEVAANMLPLQIFMEDHGYSPKQMVNFLIKNNFLDKNAYKYYYNALGKDGLTTLIERTLKKGGKLTKKK